MISSPAQDAFFRQISGGSSCHSNGQDVRSMASELQRLRQHVSRQDIMLDEFHDSISQLVRDQPLTFTVLQYNILARYLGNNTEPWLL